MQLFKQHPNGYLQLIMARNRLRLDDGTQIVIDAWETPEESRPYRPHGRVFFRYARKSELGAPYFSHEYRTSPKALGLKWDDELTLHDWARHNTAYRENKRVIIVDSLTALCNCPSDYAKEDAALSEFCPIHGLEQFRTPAHVHTNYISQQLRRLDQLETRAMKTKPKLVKDVKLKRNCILLFSCEIAGAQYVGAAPLLHKAHIGAEMELALEPGNIHDRMAVAVLYRGRMVGYIPRDHNNLPSRLLAAGAKVFAHVVSKDGEANHIRSYMQIGVYLRLEK